MRVWFTHGSDGQAGPFDARQLAEKFQRGELGWTDEVWREGLRAWRPARKDEVLVVDVAAVSGLGAATVRLDDAARLLHAEVAADDDVVELLAHEDTVVEARPAELAHSWPARPALLGNLRPSRSQTLARALKVLTMALLAFIGGGLIVGVLTRLTDLPGEQAAVPPAAPQVASAALLSAAPLAAAPPEASLRSLRTLPALDEIRSELRRLELSARRCVRDGKASLELELVIAGDSGSPRQIDVRTRRLTPGMIECSQAALQSLHVAPFAAEELRYRHRYRW